MTKNPITICIASDKGGVGKTASTASLGYSLSAKGYSVLLIDSDPQGNLSSKFGFDPANRCDNYIGSLINNRIDIQEHPAIMNYINHNPEYPNIDIIVSDQRLDAIYSVLAQVPFKNTGIFREILDEIKALNKYDFILFDTRPALRNEVAAALVASDWVLIPILAANDAIIGANDVLMFMTHCRQLNPGLKTLGIFFNRIQSRTKAFQEIKPLIQDSWKDYLLQTTIPQSQTVVNAENNDSPVTKIYPTSKVAKSFESLLEEVLARVLEK